MIEHDDKADDKLKMVMRILLVSLSLSHKHKQIWQTGHVRFTCALELEKNVRATKTRSVTF